jgi:mevalonate pyrophosphate decarboxylase
MRLTVEERVFILESYLKTMSYSHCRQSFFEKFRILKMNINNNNNLLTANGLSSGGSGTRAIEEVK